MLKKFEKDLNNRLIDWIIGGSYLGDNGQKFFEKIKKNGREAYAHILVQYERFKNWYRS